VTRGKLLILAVVLFLLSAFSCYHTAFYAWLTATPLPSGELATVQCLFYCWFAATILAFFAGVGVLVRRSKK